MHESIGLSQALAGREDEFPILTRALANATQAMRTTIEWARDEDTTWFNFTQILRHPFGVTNTARAPDWYSVDDMWERFKKKRLLEHLIDIEKTLEHSVLHRETRYRIDPETNEIYSYEYKTMGGTKFYLGRDLEDGDVLSLHVLQDTLYFDRSGPDVDGLEGEFLTEFSLAVVPSSVPPSQES